MLMLYMNITAICRATLAQFPMLMIFSLVISLLTTSSFASESASPVASQKEFIVAIESDDVVTKIIFDAISKHERIDVVYREYESFGDILDSVEKGESDFAANVTYTPERAKYLHFSSPTNIEYTYLYSLSGLDLNNAKIVGVPKDTIFASLIKESYPQIQILEYQNFDQATSWVLNGDVDGIVDAINRLKPMLNMGLDASLLNNEISIKPVSIVSTKGHNEAWLTEFVKKVHSEEIQRSIVHGVNQYQLNLRQEALRKELRHSGIDTEKPLKVKLEPVYPYSQFDRSGKTSGISSDVVLQVCNILALKCRVENEPDETWEQMYNDFLYRRIDILAPLTISESRKSFTYFTEPHYFPEGYIVKRLGYKNNVYRHVSELITEKIGVVKDDFFDTLITKMLPRKRLYRYKNLNNLVEALLSKEVDYIALDIGSLHHLLRNDAYLPIEEDHAIGAFYESKIAIGFSKTPRGKVLAPFFTRAMGMIDNEKIISTYDLEPDWRSSLQVQQEYTRRSQIMFALFVILSGCGMLYLNRQSNTDKLTGLRNRRALMRRYRLNVPEDVQLLYLDINHFKPINDTYGHSVGDAVLQAITKGIKRHWKGQAYRIGGDEFVLVGRLNDDEVETAISKLRTVEMSLPASSDSLLIHTAIGVSKQRSKPFNLQYVLKLADQAMYTEKTKLRRRHGD